MERLTEWIGEGEDQKAIARQDLRTIGDKDCVARLAAYEDTRLNPEDVNTLKEKFRELYYIFDECCPDDPVHFQGLLDKLKGWHQAEKDGRLVVLPSDPPGGRGGAKEVRHMVAYYKDGEGEVRQSLMPWIGR